VFDKAIAHIAEPERHRVIRGFADLRGTAFSSAPDRYFDGMVDTVNRDEGTVNKYNGDNIPVLRSAPLVSFGFAMGYQ
jgi:hypothetical protein